MACWLLAVLAVVLIDMPWRPGIACRLCSSHIEGKPIDQVHMLSCQRTALAAAAFTDDQKAHIIAAFNEAAREAHKLQSDVDQLNARLSEVRLDGEMTRGVRVLHPV